MNTTAPATHDNRGFYWMVPVVFIASVMAFYRLAYPLLNDNDVPWHLAIGQLLLDTHQLPKTDPWAYGNQEQPWFILSWVWNLLIGISQKCFGELGAYIFTISSGAALTAGVTARLLKLNIALPAVLMVSMLMALCLLDYITARPQMTGYMLAFAFHALLHRSRSDSGYKNLHWLPLLMLVWTNAHGSFMVGFIIIAAFLIEAYKAQNKAWLKRLLVISAACGVCGVINPYGPMVVIGALLSFKGSATQYTAEWMPFSFATSTGLSLWLMIFIATSNLKIQSVTIADKVLAFGWLLATMLSIRNGAFFILLAAPYMARCLDEQTREMRKEPPRSPVMEYMGRQKLSHVWVGCTLLFAALCVVAKVLPHDEQIQSEDYSIKDAIDFALEKYPNNHFYSDYSFGGQIIYHTQGKLSFFMDSRAVTAYTDEAMKETLNFLKLGDGWQDDMHKRKLNGLIVGKNVAFATSYAKGLFHDHWKLVFEGKRANVYVATTKK